FLDIPGDDFEILWIKAEIGEVFTKQPIGDKCGFGRSENGFPKDKVLHGKGSDSYYQYTCSSSKDMPSQFLDVLEKGHFIRTLFPTLFCHIMDSRIERKCEYRKVSADVLNRRFRPLYLYLHHRPIRYNTHRQKA